MGVSPPASVVRNGAVRSEMSDLEGEGEVRVTSLLLGGGVLAGADSSDLTLFSQ